MFKAFLISLEDLFTKFLFLFIITIFTKILFLLYREAEHEELEKESRLDKLRLFARKRLGVHTLPPDKDRFTYLTQVSFIIG